MSRVRLRVVLLLRKLLVQTRMASIKFVGVAVHVIKAKIAEADEAEVEAGVIEAEKGATAAVADFVATVVEEKEGIADVAEVDEEEIVAAVIDAPS